MLNSSLLSGYLKKEGSSNLFKPRLRRQYNPDDTDIAELFLKIRKHNTGEGIDEIRELINRVRNINDVDLNDNGNTLLHVAVSKRHKDIVQCLLKRDGININAKNDKNETPLDIAYELSKKTNVLGDSSCLFWSVALGYLTSARQSDSDYLKRFKELFGEIDTRHYVKIKEAIQRPTLDESIYSDQELQNCVKIEFRNRVANEISSRKSDFVELIKIDDFLEGKNAKYFTSGDFAKKFLNIPRGEIDQYRIKFDKLKPTIFDEDAASAINDELNKIEDKTKLRECMFSAYLKYIRQPDTWGGEFEISAMSSLLKIVITIYTGDGKVKSFGLEKGYSNEVYLFLTNSHYQFYEVNNESISIAKLLQSYEKPVRRVVAPPSNEEKTFVKNFVEIFETKLAIYHELGKKARGEGKIFNEGVDITKTVRHVFGFPAYMGKRKFNARTDWKRGGINRTKVFLNLSDLIEMFIKYELGVRKLLVDAGCDIFQSFEMQFMNIGVNNFPALANDIVDKIIDYYTKKEYEKNTEDSKIAGALVSGSFSKAGTLRKMVSYGEEEYDIKSLYEDIGIVKGEGDSLVYYKKKGSGANKYGYRRLFMDEMLRTVYDVDTDTETANKELREYKYTLLHQRDFPNHLKDVLHVIGKEIGVPDKVRVMNFIEKIRTNIMGEIGDLRRQLTDSLMARRKSVAGKVAEPFRKDDLTKSLNRKRTIEISEETLSSMKSNLERLDSNYYSELRGILVKRAGKTFQQNLELLKPQWGKLKALVSGVGGLSLKDVVNSVEEFTGRREQVNNIHEKLQNENAVVIVGKSGIGKTQLARRYVSQNKGTYLNTYEADAETISLVEKSFTSLLKKELGMYMAEDERSPNSEKALVVIHGAKKEHVKSLLGIPSLHGGFKFLFTSHDEDFENTEQRIRLGDFEREDAIELARKIFGTTESSEDEQIGTLVTKLGYFPLAIKQVGTFIKERNLLNPAFQIHQYLTEYESLEGTWGDVQDKYTKIVSITLEIFIQTITQERPQEETQKISHVLNTMAYFGPGPVDLWLIPSLGEDTGLELSNVFELLKQYYIVDKTGKDEYIMHELVKTVIRSTHNMDKKKEVLALIMKHIEKTLDTEDLTAEHVNHLIHLFDYSKTYIDLMNERDLFAPMILGFLNQRGEYKRVLKFGGDILTSSTTTKEGGLLVEYEMACARISLGMYDLGLQILLNKLDGIEDVLGKFNLEKKVLSTYLQQIRYENILSNFVSRVEKESNYEKALLYAKEKLTSLDNADSGAVLNYLDAATNVAEIFVIQGEYNLGLTILHYIRELKQHIILRKELPDTDLSDGIYHYSDLYDSITLQERCIVAIAQLYMVRSNMYIHEKGEHFLNGEDFLYQIAFSKLIGYLTDLLTNQKNSLCLPRDAYSIERTPQQSLKNNALKIFQDVKKRRKSYMLLENDSETLYVEFYIALSHYYSGKKGKALAAFHNLQEAQEKIVGLNHPMVLATICIIQELRVKDKEKKKYLEDEIKKRNFIERSGNSILNDRSLSILNEIYSSLKSNGCTPAKRARIERNLDMQCTDSRDEENIEEKKEKKELIQELFDAERVGDRFYNHLFEVYKKISKGETVSQNIEEALRTNLEDIDLNLVDPGIRDIVREMKEADTGEVRAILSRPRVGENIGKVVNGGNFMLAMFFVGKHAANADIEGLGYDALNLWIMPEIGKKFSGEIFELGVKLESKILKGSAPIMGHSIGNLAAFLGLEESIKARLNARDSVDIKVAELNMATNSIAIIGNVPVIVNEIMLAAGMEAGLIGRLVEPGSAAALVSIIFQQFLQPKFEVEKLEELISLTYQESTNLYWRFFLGMQTPDYIEHDVEAKQIYEQYILGIINTFKDNYNEIGVSLPDILVEEHTLRYCAGTACSSVIRDRKERLEDTTREVDVVVQDEQSANYNISRVIPSIIDDYGIVCGPFNQDIAEEITKILGKEKSYVMHETQVKRWYLEGYPDECDGAVVYERKGASSSLKTLYYLSHSTANVHINIKNGIDIIFKGKDISVVSNDTEDEKNRGLINRYYFTNSLINCTVHNSRTNVFYIEGTKKFFCFLVSPYEQNNIVVTQGNFTDFPNIHSVIGNNKTNYIEVSHASYVDGKGGSDVITANNSTTIQGYFGDSIHGNGVALLPMNFSDIDEITYANNITNIYNKNKDFISVDSQTLVKTADGLFVIPIVVGNRTNTVTNLHVIKRVDNNIRLDDELNDLREMDNPKFNVTKQLLGTNSTSVIGGFGNNIFYADKEHHNFYWEAPDNKSHLYLFDERNANITLARANGILDFRQFNGTPLIKDDKGEIKIDKNGLHLTLQSDYRDIIITLDGERYYKPYRGVLERDYCSHNLKIDGRYSVNSTNLPNHYNCFTFDSNKVFFLKLNSNLLLLSNKGTLLLSDYYSFVRGNWDLSIELNDWIIGPEEFKERASNSSSLRYYKPNEQGLQIYYNQPVNKYSIGLVSLKDRSISDFIMKIVDGDLILSSGNNTIIQVKDWNTYPPAREMMFIFNDTRISNMKCIVSNCDPEDIVKEFEDKVVEFDIHFSNDDTPMLSALKRDDLGEFKFCFNESASTINDTVDRSGNTLLHYAAYFERIEIAEFLFENHVDINAVNNKGRTSLYLAERYTKSRMVELLNGEAERRKDLYPIRHRRHKQHHREHLQERRRVGATSGASKPSSWINDLFDWVKDSVGGLFGSKVTLPGKPGNSTVQSLPNISQHNETAKGSSPSSFLSVENVALIGCIADALDNTQSKCYQTSKSQGVNFVPSIQTAVNFARREFDSFVEDKIRNLDSKEKARIRTEVKNAYPEIIESFRRGVEFSGNIGLDDVLEKCKKCFCTNILPNNVSQSESQMLGKTDDKPKTRLSDVTVNNQQITGHTK